MDNPTMARLLAETADLLEIDGGDSFRIRSYRRAAEAVEQTTVDLATAASDTAREPEPARRIENRRRRLEPNAPNPPWPDVERSWLKSSWEFFPSGLPPQS